MKRVFIIHGWGGYPEEGCFPWLKKELEARNFKTYTPAMPEPSNPKIETWVSFLAKQVEKPDKNTFFVGHSIGAQTVLRYLESLEGDARIGGVILLAGWIHLTDKACEDDEDKFIAKPWLETPINWEKIKSHTDNIVAIFSDNDPLVPFDDSKIFQEKLGAKIIVEHKRGHFSGSDGVKELPIVLEEILNISK